MDYLLVDGNSVGFAAQAGTKLTVGEEEVQAIYGFLRSLRSTLEKFPETYKPVVLWDGKAQWRFDLYPGYKDRQGKNAKIDAMREAYKKQRPLIARGLKLLGVTQSMCPHAEADDLAGHYSQLMSRKGSRVVLMTGDKDWMQLVDENVSWYEHRADREKLVGMHNFHDETGYLTTRGFVEGKALQGDSSDTIKGVGGIGEKGAAEFIAEFGSVEGFLKQVADGSYKPKKKALEKLANNELPGREGYPVPMLDAFYRNLRLMDLRNGQKLGRDDIKTTKADFDKEGFREFCEDLFFRSILKEFDEWVKVFEVR